MSMLDQKTKISVVITTYNRAALVTKAIDSVLNQKSAADEIIVVDDGSTDGTDRIIQDKYPQIKYLYQDNQGISAARNLGIMQARNLWIAFLDSDDEWLSDKLVKQRAALLANPDYKICHTDEIWIRKGKRVNQMKKHKKHGGDIYTYCLPLCIISPSSVVIHQDIFLKYGVFDIHLPACEDYDMWLRICAFEKVFYLDEPLIKKYGGHSDQLSHKYWGMDRFRIKALQKILGNNLLGADKKKITIKMLLDKIRIYNAGAEKRGKKGNTEYYSDLYKKYQILLRSRYSQINIP
jgi:glycosyltransferase involved in cell wall biosynthesis